MAGIKYNHNMFTVGMISQKLQGNTESETYNNSLLDCKNFYIRQTGGVFKRPGTLFVDTIPDALRVKLFPFNFPGDDSVVLGFQAGSVYAYNTTGIIAKFDTPDLTSDVINDEHFTPIQNGNFVYLFTKTGIYEIKFIPDTKTLTFAKKDFTFAPTGKINDVKTDTATYTSSTITLSGNAEFENSDVGQRILLLWERPVDPDDTELRYMYQTTLLYSYFTITALTDEKTATVTWDKNYSSVGDSTKIPSEATFRFALPAFGADRGYPIAAGVLSNRLFLADNDLMIYGSRISFDDLFDFTLGSDETCGLSYRMNNDVGTISWLVGQDKLFVGTPTGIYASGGSGVYAEEIIAPGNFSLRKFSSVHAGTLLPSAINASIVFTDALSKNVYEIAVDETVGVYKTFDLSLLSNELLNSGCISHAWSSYPVKTYWVACKDGTLASMTYEKANNVLAWSYHDLGGENSAVESVASIQINGYDYVFLVVRRTHEGEIIRKVEYIDKLYEPLDNKQYQQHYADSGHVLNYKYQITGISQYAPPQIEFQDTFGNDSVYQLFVQNENSKTQYIKCMLYDAAQHVAKDIYVEKAWRNTAEQNEDTTTAYVSFCELEEKVQHLAPDGRDLVTYEQKPLDVHKLKDFSSDAFVGVMLEHIEGVEYFSQDNKLVLYCEPSTIPANVTEILLNDTGMKDGNGDSYDTSAGYTRLLTISSRDISTYNTTHPGILIDVPNGYEADSFNPNGLREIYGDAPFVTAPTYNAGSNAIVSQSVDVATAIAITELKPNIPDESDGRLGGIVWNGNEYVVAYNNAVYKVASDWGNWNKVYAGEDFTRFFDLSYISGTGYNFFNQLQRFMSSDDTFNNVATSNFPTPFCIDLGADGTYCVMSKRLIPMDSTARICAYYGTTDNWNNQTEIADTENSRNLLLVNNSATRADARTLAVFQDDDNKITWKLYNGIESITETSSGALDDTETRIVYSVIPVGERASNKYDSAYLIGFAGLLYRIDLTDLSNITFDYVDLKYKCDWLYGASHKVSADDNEILLASGKGELLIIKEHTGQDPVYEFQTINITSGINGVYAANGRYFISLSDGNILRSVPAYTYTQSYFDSQYVFIDDVVGMEKVNGKKYIIKNLDTSMLDTGIVKYEIWDGTHPVDTRPLGVYDSTVTNNGTGYIYFNKIVGIGHLAGEKVTVSLDGNFLDDFTVSSGGVIGFDADVFGMEAHVGYKFISALELMPLSGGNLRGSSVGSVGSQKAAFARLYYSLGGKYGTDADSMYPIGYPTALFRSSYDKVVELFTGLIELPVMNPRDYRERKFRMEQSEPVCFNVLSIAQDAEISDA